MQNIEEMVRKLHAAELNLVYVCAGAGTDALGALFTQAGASRTVLECVVPYSPASFQHFLGRVPRKHVSRQTALRLAGRALTRAQLLTVENAPLLGIACTAAIVTDRVKRGKHRAHIATWQNHLITNHYVELEKGVRNRQQEEAMVSSVVLNALAEAADLDVQIPVSWGASDKYEVVQHNVLDAAQRLYNDEIPYFGLHDFGRIRHQDANPQVLLPGSFNPLHAGHLALAEAASKFLDKPVAFELAVSNVDKPALAQDEALSRMAQFAGQHPIYLTRAATFLEKSRVFGPTTYVIGHDTAARIVALRYYADLEQQSAALNEMVANGTHFLVAPRIGPDGELKTLGDIQMSADARRLFTALPEFRVDLSSTALRASGLRGSR